MHNLALILFLPWFLILGVLYWLLPRGLPRSPARIGFDLAALAIAVTLSVYGMRWGMVNADMSYGRMWPQVLATVLAYKAFLIVIALAWWTRSKLFR
jgi:hypothetical protein